jgi:N-acetylmuramoyl-L-alanine amidase
MEKRKNNPIGVIIHCSDSLFGDVETFRKWHLDNGWDDVGYNWIITNGVLQHGSEYIKEHDGIIQPGRSFEYIGAHAKGYNESHLSICLTGRWHFTWRQFAAMFEQLKRIKQEHVPTLTIENIIGHYEVNQRGKTCPNIDMGSMREYLVKNL